LRHRTAFLDAGYFDDIALNIAEHIQQSDTQPIRGVAHLGCRVRHRASPCEDGEGPLTACRWHRHRYFQRRGATGCSAVAEVAFAVADLWTEWPVQDAAVDLVVSIFAPKNFPEAARVLRQGGWLVVVYPGKDHLTELRDRFGLMRRHEPADRRYADAVSSFVGPQTVKRLHWKTVLDDVAIRSAILNGS
jgi:23S rRNA (guanine745-N1)-methyltransferase